MNYIDRGDPSDWDFDIGDFIIDTDPHELDLSAIVPEGAKVVHFRVNAIFESTDDCITFFKCGDSFELNGHQIIVQAAGQVDVGDIFIELDDNRKIAYEAGSGAPPISALNLVVRGWFL